MRRTDSLSLSREEAGWLDSLSRPQLGVRNAEIRGQYTVEADLNPHEICLVVLTKTDDMMASDRSWRP